MYYRLAGKHVTLMGGKVIAYKLHSNGAERRGGALRGAARHCAVGRHIYYSTQLASFLVGSFAYLAILLLLL